MHIKSLFLIALISLTSCAFGQETEKPKVYRPDIPGNFLIDFGVTGTVQSPNHFFIGWFGSRTINLYYYYPIRLGQSKFSFNPGIGLGLDRFKFKNYYFVADSMRDGKYEMVPNYRADPDSIVFPHLKKSILGMHYLDIPLEFKFNANPDDPSRTFWFSVGGRAGYLLDPFTKIKYKVDGEKRVMIDKSFHGLDKFRYGLSGRVGFGNFNLFFFYNLKPLFEKDKGPSSKMTTFNTGISIIGL